jgi:hypothetical protein
MENKAKCQHIIVIERLNTEERCPKEAVCTLEYEGQKVFLCKDHWTKRTEQLQKDNKITKIDGNNAITTEEPEDVAADGEDQIVEEEAPEEEAEPVKIKKFLDPCFLPLLKRYSKPVKLVEEEPKEEAPPEEPKPSSSTTESPTEEVKTPVVTPNKAALMKKFQMMVALNVIEKAVGNTPFKIPGLANAVMQNEAFDEIIKEMAEPPKEFTKQKKDIFSIRKHDSANTKFVKLIGQTVVNIMPTALLNGFLPPEVAQMMTVMSAAQGLSTATPAALPTSVTKQETPAAAPQVPVVEDPPEIPSARDRTRRKR